MAAYLEPQLEWVRAVCGECHGMDTRVPCKPCKGTGHVSVATFESVVCMFEAMRASSIEVEEKVPEPSIIVEDHVCLHCAANTDYMDLGCPGCLSRFVLEAEPEQDPASGD